MYTLANEYLQQDITKDASALRMVTDINWRSYIFLTCQDDKDCDNIMTVEGIKRMHEEELRMKELEGYTDLCKAKSSSDTDCDPAGLISLTNQFASQLESDSLTQADIDDFTSDLKTNEGLWVGNKFLFGNDYDRNATSPKTRYLRTIILFASPIKWEGTQYKSPFDRVKKQDSAMKSFSKDLKKEFKKVSTKSFTVRFFNGISVGDEIMETFNKDFVFVSISIVLVFCYMWFTLRSFWMTVNSMINICVSFPITLVIYRGLF